MKSHMIWWSGSESKGLSSETPRALKFFKITCNWSHSRQISFVIDVPKNAFVILKKGHILFLKASLPHQKSCICSINRNYSIFFCQIYWWSLTNDNPIKLSHELCIEIPKNKKVKYKHTLLYVIKWLRKTLLNYFSLSQSYLLRQAADLAFHWGAQKYVLH